MDCLYHCTITRCLITLIIFFVMECYVDFLAHRLYTPWVRKPYLIISEVGNGTVNNVKQQQHKAIVYYKYPLINGTEVAMDYDHGYNSSYYWFMATKHLFKYIGHEAIMRYSRSTPICKLGNNSLGPIKVKKYLTTLQWIEKRNPHVRIGGYYAPAHCRAAHRVAVIVPFRNREVNLAVFLRYIHPLLKKQLIEYRIFVIEQYGKQKFNKGTLYNIAFLETQRFGTWHCLIFHDVDLIPEDERIPYSCPEHPTHMASAVESFGYRLPYRLIFGGVTALTPEHYKAVNGYSNFYWNWGAKDDDFFGRFLLLMISKIRYKKEGLATTKYKLINVTEEKLYTHILADVNPTNMKLDTKSVMQRVLRLQGEPIVYGQREVKLSNPSKL